MVEAEPKTEPKTEPKIESMVLLANAVARRVQIDSVSIINSRLLRHPLPDADVPDEVAIRSALKVSHKLHDESKCLNVVIAFRCTGDDGRETDDPRPLIFEIEATFAIAYSLRDVEGVQDRHVNAFAKMNGVYNAWPYWREYVQNSLGRMGLPPLTLPVMTAG
jgi:hypothetical protein